MLTYQIKNQRVAHKSRLPSHIGNLSNSLFDSKEAIFERHSKKCYFKTGDMVVFKKPRRNKVIGTITHIEEDFTKVSWMNGGNTPAILTVQLADKGNQKGIVVKAPLKSIIFHN